MNGANLSTYVYQGKKKSTQFTIRAHKKDTRDPHQGYITENQCNTTHIRYTKKDLSNSTDPQHVLKSLANLPNFDWRGGEMLGKAGKWQELTSLREVYY